MLYENTGAEPTFVSKRSVREHKMKMKDEPPVFVPDTTWKKLVAAILICSVIVGALIIGGAIGGTGRNQLKFTNLLL